MSDPLQPTREGKMLVWPHLLQGSEDWLRIRKGRPTASQFGKIFTAATGKVSAQARKYMIHLITECYFPDRVDWAGNKWTDRGNELEHVGRAAFTIKTGIEVDAVGFVTRMDGIVGCSPDALIRAPGGAAVAGLEIKCPSPQTHLHYALEGKLPDVYKQQVHGGMAVSGLNRWHFLSYTPGWEPFHVVVHRDAYTEKLSAAIDEFLIGYGALRERADEVVRCDPEKYAALEPLLADLTYRPPVEEDELDEAA